MGARACLWVLVLAGASGCALFEDPREELARLGVPYSAEALIAQAGEGDVRAVELLLDSGMPPDVKDTHGINALTNAAAGGHVAVVEALLRADASADVANPAGPTPLTAAAWGGHREIVETLLEHGASVNARDGDDQTPLMLAVRARHVPVVEVLLERGAQAWAQDGPWSALMLAAFLGDVPIVRLLLDAGANVNAADDRGMTALMHAAGAGHVEIVEALLATRANIDAVDAGGHTALMFAAHNGQGAAVAALRKHGADPLLRNHNGRTAADYAAMNGHRRIVELLESSPATWSGPVDAAPRPLHAPARDLSSGEERAAARVRAEQGEARLELQRLSARHLRWPDDRAVFADAARRAWAFVRGHEEPATGLVTAIPGYPYATIWDIGSMLAAIYSARALGLIDDAAYATRISRILGTLARLPLYDDRVFNMAYHTRTGGMAGRAPAPVGEWGWSTTDLGRLLIWLKIIAGDIRFAQRAEAVVQRNDFDAAVRGGYLWSEVLDERRHPRTYQEGRIGYEQYAARGFALWGYRAEKALNLRANAVPIVVMGQTLYADVRRWDRLTSEPFVLWGLELGWDGAAAALARRILLAQEARYRATGVVTIAGEDALNVPPHYFYYYCLYANGRAFALDVQNARAVVDAPRWVSTKSAFGFHALIPSGYTAVALRALRRAATPNGWASGVDEATWESTGVLNLNTAAVILTAALVHERGEPLLPHAFETTNESI